MSVLKWVECRNSPEHGGERYGWRANTAIGGYLAFDLGHNCFWEFRQEGVPIAGKHVKTGTARAACEADYIARCTELLPLVKPRQVAVEVDDIRTVIRIANRAEWFDVHPRTR